MKNERFLTKDMCSNGLDIFLKEVLYIRGEPSKIGITVNVSGFVKMKFTQKTK